MLISFSFAGKTRCFELLQTFPTSGGKAAMSFEVQNELFVAFINHGNSSVKYKAKLPGYVLQNNTFTLNQTLDTSGITDVEYFTIHGEHFLAVVNALDGKSTKEGFVLYRFEAETFKEIQHIPIYNVQDIHYFIINTRIFMANSMTFSNQVSIYELKNNKTQNIASAAHLPLTTSRTLHVAAWLISMQAQFWYGLETNFNYSRIFPRPVSWTAHTVSKLMVYFILLSQIISHRIQAKPPLIRTFTAGTEPSLSTTRISRLMAPWTGILSRLPMAKSSSSWLKHLNSLHFTRWVTVNLTCTKNCQQQGQYTCMLPSTKESSIWRLWTILMERVSTSTVQCTYRNEL